MNKRPYSSRLRAVTCQRCGSGFVLTTNYLDLLARRGVKVVVPALCPTCFLATGPLRKERGKVKWFDSRKHYGFIITEEGKEVFFHENRFLEAVWTGQRRARWPCSTFAIVSKAPKR